MMNGKPPVDIGAKRIVSDEGDSEHGPVDESRGNDRARDRPTISIFKQRH